MGANITAPVEINGSTKVLYAFACLFICLSVVFRSSSYSGGLHSYAQNLWWTLYDCTLTKRPCLQVSLHLPDLHTIRATLGYPWFYDMEDMMITPLELARMSDRSMLIHCVTSTLSCHALSLLFLSIPFFALLFFALLLFYSLSWQAHSHTYKCARAQGSRHDKLWGRNAAILASVIMYLVYFKCVIVVS